MTPYVKTYDENGKVSNPITKENPYLHTEHSIADNFKEDRFKGNKKGISLTVTKTTKYARRIQIVKPLFVLDLMGKATDEMTKQKTIVHYDLRK